MTRDDRKAALTEVHQSLHEEYHEMTRDDIIRMAREASGESDYDFPNIFALERFAAVVAAAEREEILKLADSLGWVDVDHIRARGDK